MRRYTGIYTVTLPSGLAKMTGRSAATMSAANSNPPFDFSISLVAWK